MIKLFIIFLFWIITFFPVIKELFASYKDPNNLYCIFVPFISLYLFFQKKKVTEFVTKPYNKAGYLLAFALLVYILSYIGEVAFISRIMMIASFILLLVFNLGKEVFYKFRFPLLFLFFMIPVPVSFYSLFSNKLKIFTTYVAEILLDLFSVPVFREGNILYFPKFQLDITEACSGIRSIVAFLMLGVLFSYGLKERWKKAIIIISSVLISLLTNTIRVTLIGIIGYYFSLDLTHGSLHQIFGTAILVVGIICMLSVCAFLKDL